MAAKAAKWLPKAAGARQKAAGGPPGPPEMAANLKGRERPPGPPKGRQRPPEHLEAIRTLVSLKMTDPIDFLWISMEFRLLPMDFSTIAYL